MRKKKQQMHYILISNSLCTLFEKNKQKNNLYLSVMKYDETNYFLVIKSLFGNYMQCILYVVSRHKKPAVLLYKDTPCKKIEKRRQLKFTRRNKIDNTMTKKKTAYTVNIT